MSRDGAVRLLGRGVVVMRVIATGQVALGLAQVVLHSVSDGSVLSIALGSLFACCGLALAFLYWFRAPQTRVDTEGLFVRPGFGRLVHHHWEEVAEVLPEGHRAPWSSLRLDSGEVVPLPGVRRSHALALAARVTPRAPQPG